MSLLLYDLLWFVLGACAGAFAGYHAGKPTAYMGEEPEHIPEGWYKLPVGADIQSGDRVWGYDDWYCAPTISYQVAKEDCFIRLETFKSPFPLEDIPPL
jgi:hypothetical protein